MKKSSRRVIEEYAEMAGNEFLNDEDLEMEAEEQDIIEATSRHSRFSGNIGDRTTPKSKEYHIGSASVT